VGVEKLFPAKFAKIKSRQDTLQTTFSVFPDIFYLPHFGYFEEDGVFQYPQAIESTHNLFHPALLICSGRRNGSWGGASGGGAGCSQGAGGVDLEDRYQSGRFVGGIEKFAII
jgi:hypothetical protein